MSTLTPAIARRRANAIALAPQLFEVLDCASPLRPPARHSLAGIDEVLFVRADDRVVVRDGRTLRLGVPDRFLSSGHARLRREGDRFRLEDLGSTNGTFVNGEPCREQVLSDNDSIEMGHTQLLFRASSPAGESADAAAFSAGGLSTILAALAIELERLPAIARSSVPVVIGGETGTGKEMVARALHELSGRSGAFVAVNCGAVSQTLLESELFGHRKGAFTGAIENRPGLVRAADGGTLFLDEIADLPAASQGALLRVLQEKEVLAVGSTEPARVDVRILAATHEDLEAKVAGGSFRADLFARISGFTLQLPPLRWRREDLGLLVASLLRKLAPDRADRVSFTCEAGRALMRHGWPMNIRELEKCLESALVLAGDSPIDLPHLPQAVGSKEKKYFFSSGGPRERGPALGDLIAVEPAAPARALSPEDARRRDELAGLLREHQGNVAAVARVLGKARMQVHRWVRRFDLRLSDFR